jgi:hypothetical protein
MIFDPENQLTEEELDKLGETDFDGFLEYLDGKSEYLKKFAKPLSSYHTKRFAVLSAESTGKKITDEEYEQADLIGKKNEQEAEERIGKKALKEQEKEMLKRNGVKNVKTNRSQWFD